MNNAHLATSARNKASELDVVPVRDETGATVGFVWLYSSDGNMGLFRSWPGR